MDHEQRHTHVGGECGDVEILPGKTQPPLQPATHRCHDRSLNAEQRFELRAVAVDVCRRREKHGATDREAALNRERGREAAHRMPDDVTDGPDCIHHSLRSTGKFQTRAAPAGRCAMSRRIERHDAIPLRQQRIAQVNEASAAAPPAVDQQNPRTALAPRPRRNASFADGNRKALRLAQPAGHALADRTARGRAENSLGPQRRETGGCPLDGAESRSGETQGCGHRDCQIERLITADSFGRNRRACRRTPPPGEFQTRAGQSYRKRCQAPPRPGIAHAEHGID